VSGAEISLAKDRRLRLAGILKGAPILAGHPGTEQASLIGTEKRRGNSHLLPGAIN